MAICKYCGEQIEFITTPTRRMIPVEKNPVYFHKVESHSEAYERFYLDNGELVYGRALKPLDFQKTRGWIPHRFRCENWKYCNTKGKGKTKK